MNRFSLLVILLLLGSYITSRAQKPQVPPNDSIRLTIDLDFGYPTISWAPPAFNPLFPDPTGYIIYKRVDDILSPLGYRNVPIDTVGPLVRSYTDLLSNGNLDTLIYFIASNGLIQPSQFSSVHTSMFIKSHYDSCNSKIDLEWNKYGGWGNRIKKYEVYVGNDLNWAAYPLHSTIPGTSTNLSITNVNENLDYYVYVKATKDITDEPGWIPYVSTSNLHHRSTAQPIHPTAMTVDSIIAEDDRTKIFFKIDPVTQLTNFQIVRWEDSDSVRSIFTRKILNTEITKLTTLYDDTEDSWTARTRPFYYKIDALNSCRIIVKTTNLANAITPKVVPEDGMKNRVGWDELFIHRAKLGRESNYATYRVTRYAFKATPMPPVFLPETDQLEIIDDVSSLAGESDPYSIKFCYQIEAFEKNLLGQVTMYSKSRTQCVDIIPGVTMPDAIMPADNTSGFGNSRNILAPIITFRADYTLNIYNRWGALIYSGDNVGWNGRTSNGQLAKEGTYIYRLTVHTLENRDVIKEGSFVVIYK